MPYNLGMLKNAYEAGWKAAAEKFAARRGLEIIRNRMQAGDIAGASRLARTPGVLKASPGGSQMKQLGAGSEGLATLVADPEHGVAVRKLFDPQGLTSPETWARKERAGQAIGANPHIAQFYGARNAPGGSRMHFNEYVPGVASPLPSSEDHLGVAITNAETQRALRAAGFHGGADVRWGNMVEHAPGQFKSIDYIPVRRGEVLLPGDPGHDPKRLPNRLQDTPAGAGLFNQHLDINHFTAEPEAKNRALLRGQLAPAAPAAPMMRPAPPKPVVSPEAMAATVNYRRA